MSKGAAEQIAPLKKASMAVTAERLLAKTRWLPPVMRSAKQDESAMARSDEVTLIAAE